MKITCPLGPCKSENELNAESCSACGVPLQGYAHLYSHPNQLFNLGLEAAREGRLKQARDYFAAVINWCPLDLEARNAMTMACFALKDYEEARMHCQLALKQSPGDAVAGRGLMSIAIASNVRPTAKKPAPSHKKKSKKKHKKKR